MISWTSILLAIAAVILVMILGKVTRKLIDGSEVNKKIRKRNLMKNKTTYFLEDEMKDEQCTICFGELEETEVIECKCGHVFHVECAELTDECPYCGATGKDMMKRPIRIPVCPRCGELIMDNICKCGFVLPNPDGSFKCVCGAKTYVDEDICKNCGSRFAVKSKE